MYIHHTPSSPEGTMSASSIVHLAYLSLDGRELVCITTFKKRNVVAGDTIMYMKVLYKVKSVFHFHSRTQIIADEAK